MRIDVLTLFPEMFAGVLGTSILKRAADPALYPDGRPPVSYHLTDIRAHTLDKHGKVDQAPYGGGPGMVMQCDPLWRAVRFVEGDPAYAGTAVPEADGGGGASGGAGGAAASGISGGAVTRILMTPQGVPLSQKMVEELATHPRLLVIAGHYEGIDERVIQRLAPLREISIGDYVLSGGELPAMVLIDAVVRLLPGVLGDETSAHHESFSAGAAGLLDYPHYTRPATWDGMEVPAILLSGDHAKIAAWRAEESRRRTQERRPDLLGGGGVQGPKSKVQSQGPQGQGPV